MYDPYSVLGVPRSASDDDVKQAFRSLAKRFHPDTAEGAADKGRRFKDLSIAYEILGDPAKRRSYDRGEIDAHGNPRPGYTPRPEREPEPEHAAQADTATKAKNGNGSAEGGGSNAFRSAFERAFGAGSSETKNKSRVEDLFSEFFGERSSGRKKPAPGKGLDSHYDLSVTFEEA